MAQVIVSSPTDAEQSGLRRVLDNLGDKWSLLILAVLEARPRRFNEIRREIGDISQRVLAVRLRDLERDGYLSRLVRPYAPPQVEYALTKMGISVLTPVTRLLLWALESTPEIEQSRTRYDLARPSPAHDMRHDLPE